MKMDTMLERIKNMADKLSISSIKDDTAMKIMKQYVDSIVEEKTKGVSLKGKIPRGLIS